MKVKCRKENNIKIEKKDKNTIIVKYQIRCLNTVDSTNPNDFENQLISPELEWK